MSCKVGHLNMQFCTIELCFICQINYGGPRSPSAYACGSARPPIDTIGNFLGHVSAELPLATTFMPAAQGQRMHFI